MIDAHCHLTDDKLFSQIDEVLNRSQAHGIEGYILGGYNSDDWERQKKLKKQIDLLFCSFGLHPVFVSSLTDIQAEREFELLTTYATECHMIGETGLDHRGLFNSSQRKIQNKYFKKHIELSNEVKKPLVLHVVKAHPEVLSIFKKTPPQFGGMVHAFHAKKEVADSYIDFGFMISIGSSLLFPNNYMIKNVIRDIGIEHILIESDAPDQPPTLLVGQSNEPWTIGLIAEEIAKIKGMTVTDVQSITKENAMYLLGNQ